MKAKSNTKREMYLHAVVAIYSRVTNGRVKDIGCMATG